MTTEEPNVAEDGTTDLANIYICLAGEEDVNEICSMLRGLLKAIGNKGGQAMKNSQFQQGVLVAFDSGATAGVFIESFGRLFRKRVRHRLLLRRE